MELIYTANESGRLSFFLRQKLKMSAGLVNRLKWQGALLVNGKPERTNYTVMPGDRISVLLDEPEPEYPAEYAPLTILYEDDIFLAVDKPAGMLIHPSRNRIEGTLANRVIGYYRQTGQRSAFHPITRLDRDTFGVVLLAKNAHAHSLMQSAPLQKTYHALTFGGPEVNFGVIDAPIARKPLPSLLREIRPDGKPSVTEFQVLERNEQICKLALIPVTGRTHQLRLHCAHMGFPILGDPQYANETSAGFSASLGLTSQLLCAKQVTFLHPFTNETVSLESKMDADLETACANKS